LCDAEAVSAAQNREMRQGVDEDDVQFVRQHSLDGRRDGGDDFKMRAAKLVL